MIYKGLRVKNVKERQVYFTATDCSIQNTPLSKKQINNRKRLISKRHPARPEPPISVCVALISIHPMRQLLIQNLLCAEQNPRACLVMQHTNIVLADFTTNLRPRPRCRDALSIDAHHIGLACSTTSWSPYLLARAS